MCNWSTFSARTNRGHTQTHKTHHGPNLGKPPPSPLIIFFVISHMGYIQMSFCLGTPKLGVLKFPKLGLSRLWRPITFCVNLWLRWGLKQNCIPCWHISNDMWHATWMQVNQGNSRLLMVMSQINTLILGLSFGHNLCFKYLNEMYMPILNIYLPRAFQCYKELFNPMSFDLCNRSQKIRESIGTPISKVGTHLGVCGFILAHPPTLPWA
jgi:hypothetical protein